MSAAAAGRQQQEQRLAAMRVTELHARALERGISAEAANAAMDADAPKAALVKLLLGAEAAAEAEQPASEAATLIALLGGGRGERASAYRTLDATSDVELGAACAEALVATLGTAAREVDAAEHRRCSLTLAHLMALDPVRVGAEWFRGMRFLSAYAKGNAVDVMLLKPLGEINKEDVRTYVAAMSAIAAMYIKGMDPPRAATGVGLFEWGSAAMAQDNVSAQMMQMYQDEAQRIRVVTLVVDLLREDRAELSEPEVAGAYMTIGASVAGNPAVALRAVQAGGRGAPDKLAHRLDHGRARPFEQIGRGAQGHLAHRPQPDRGAPALGGRHAGAAGRTPRRVESVRDGRPRRGERVRSDECGGQFVRAGRCAVRGRRGQPEGRAGGGGLDSPWAVKSFRRPLLHFISVSP
jgi:hypothetical protein